MLTRKHLFLVAVFSVTLLAAVTGAALAQPQDKRTVFTFSGPVALPGVTLPAGQYIFRLADPVTSGKVVQVLSGDGRTPYALLFTLPAERVEPATTPEVRFMETAAGMPTAITTWWYPGDRRGFEFVYPKEQARRLAQGTTQPVLTTQAATTTTEQTDSPDLARVSASGQEMKVDPDAAPVAETPTGSSQAGEVASPNLVMARPVLPTLTDAGPVADRRSAAGSSATRRALPATATVWPAVALGASLAMAAGVCLATRRRGPRGG